MNYKAKYIKYKLKYLRAKQLYGGSRLPFPKSSAEAAQDEINLEKKKAQEAKEQGKDALARISPHSSSIYPYEPGKNKTYKDKPTLGNSPSKETETETQTDVMPNLNLGKPEMPTKK